MRITSFFIASAFICTATAANADIVEFSYQGQDFICTQHEPYSDCGEFGSTSRGWQGGITIDTDLYPLSHLDSTTLRLSFDIGDESSVDQEYRVFSTTVTSGSAQDIRTLVMPLYSGPYNSEIWESDPLFEFVEIDGFFVYTLTYIVGPSPSFVEITINDDLSVTEWRFDSGLKGSIGEDYGSSNRGDSYSDGYASLGPGSWSVLVNGAPPVSDGAPPVSPVPLPASALLLLAGLGGLAAFRKRGSSA